MRARVAIALAVVASEARAVDLKVRGESLRLDITHSTFHNVHLLTDDTDPLLNNYGEWISRLNAQLAWRRFLFGMRFDSVAILPPTECKTPVVRCKNRFGIDENGRSSRQPLYDPRKGFEKVYLTYAGRDVEATVGDVYVNFGRGLVLSIRKIDELGIDTTLMGGKFALRTGSFAATAVFGATNIQNYDETRSWYTPDPYDLLGGVRLEYRAKGYAILGVQAAAGTPSKSTMALGERDYYTRSGVSIELPPRLVRWLSLYAEYARREDRRLKGRDTGDALYASATVYAGRSVWLLEGQHYRAFEPVRASVDPQSPVASALLYQQAPTLERVQTQFTTNSDVSGARLRVDVAFTPSLTLFASSRFGKLSESMIGHTLVDTYFGMQLRWDDGLSQFFPLFGYRWEKNDAEDTLYEELIATEWTAVQALPKNLSLESQGQLWVRRKPFQSENPWMEGQIYLALKWAPRMIAAVGYELNTSLDEGHGFASRVKLPAGHYFNGSLQWNITPDTSVRLFAGGQRAGLKCISGVCRFFPPFEGVKLDVVIRL